MTRSPLQCCTSIIRSSALVQVSSNLFLVHTCAWSRRLPVTEMHFRHFSREYQKSFWIPTPSTAMNFVKLQKQSKKLNFFAAAGFCHVCQDSLSIPSNVITFLNGCWFFSEKKFCFGANIVALDGVRKKVRVSSQIKKAIIKQ